MWIKHSEDNNIPSWLKDNVRSVCSCGAPIENFYNEDGRCTNRRCSSNICPSKLAMRAANMFTVLNVDGFKEGKSLSVIKDYKLTSHFQVIPHALGGTKLRIDLAKYLKICFIPKISEQWNAETDGFSTPSEFVAGYKGKFKDEVEAYKDVILSGEPFFDFIAPTVYEKEPLITGTIMISGNVIGFPTKEGFVGAINGTFKGYVRLGLTKSARRTGMMALIKENQNDMTTKLQVARETGIPVFTSTEFITYLLNSLSEKGVDVNEFA